MTDYYNRFLGYFSKFRIFFLWPLTCVFLVWQMVVFEDPTWILMGILLHHPFHQLGFAIGGHKLFAHRAFVPKDWYPYLSAFVASISFHGNPIMAAIVHREHHRYSDSDLDPHSPVNGRWHAFMGWMWNYSPPPPSARIAADLVRDFPFLKTYEKVEWMVLPVFYITLAFISKWLMLACLLAGASSFGFGLFLNTFTHDAKLPGDNKSINHIMLARFVNPVFLHKDHHDRGYLYDYSTKDVTDYPGKFIKRFLVKHD